MAVKTKAKEKALSFEEALAGLEKSSDTLKREEISLEETMKNFDEGIKYYNICNDILNDAKQKIEIYKQD